MEKSISKKILLLALVALITVPFANIASAQTAPISPASTNLISNPSVEQATRSFSILLGTPTNWSKYNNSKNVALFYYPVTGHNSARAIQVQVIYYKTDKEGWYFNNVNVSPSNQYNYSNYYISNVTSYISATFKLSNGSSSVVELGQVAPASKWTQASETFTPPAGAVSVTVMQYLKSNGSLTTDDYSLTLSTPTQTPPLRS